ncbi:amphi-Trp domain-containing protein [Streptomyces sp. NPDC088788]|uniref:amphi-Trp domain-containing protein n=1 Tax=Streptomyces sp. NPDC088788 TaxID=3365898 RepID=UPI0037FB1747
MPIGDMMRDLKFEQKRSMSRQEAADQLTALATALRDGGEAELELGSGKLNLRIPDDLRSEIEVEVSSGEIELEIEFKWPTSSRARASRAGAVAEDATPRQAKPATPARSGTATKKARTARRKS